MCGVKLGHAIGLLGIVAEVEHLHRLDRARIETDVVDILTLAERMRLHDERPGAFHKRQLLALSHGHDLRVLQIPHLVQSVDQKVRPAVG